MAEKEKGFWDYATPILTEIGSTAATGLYNNYAINKQNTFNAVEAEKQRQYETMMSNTAYQRQAADMAAAGLNPHLAGGQGGSSTPTGVAATSGSMMPLDISGAMNAASNAALTKAQVDNMKADTELKGKQSGKTKAETKLTETMNDLQPALIQSQIKLNNATSKKTRQEALTEVERTGIAGFEKIMLGMDKQKRKRNFDKELELYTAELELQLIQTGYNSSDVGLVINNITNTLGKLSGLINAGVSIHNANTMAGALRGNNSINIQKPTIHTTSPSGLKLSQWDM